MAERKRKYQDVEDLLKQNPGMSISDAGRQLGYERELQDKGGGRVGLRNRHVDGERAKAEAVQRGDAPRYKPPGVPGMDRHHKRMIMLYKPLFEGLSEADSLALSKHAASQGMDLGDVELNFEYLSKDSHNKIHRYMERQGMRPRDMPDFSKADLPNRKKAFDVLFRDFIQADIDNELRRLRMKRTVSGNATDIMRSRPLKMPGAFSRALSSGSDIVDRANAGMSIGTPMLADLGLELF
tara:strand:+ start:42 stop:758 length:717 start_codon:yes stop_codon:yes gene_type:complete